MSLFGNFSKWKQKQIVAENFVNVGQKENGCWDRGSIFSKVGDSAWTYDGAHPSCTSWWGWSHETPSHTHSIQRLVWILCCWKGKGWKTWTWSWIVEGTRIAGGELWFVLYRCEWWSCWWEVKCKDCGSCVAWFSFKCSTCSTCLKQGWGATHGPWSFKVHWTFGAWWYLLEMRSGTYNVEFADSVATFTFTIGSKGHMRELKDTWPCFKFLGWESCWSCQEHCKCIPTSAQGNAWSWSSH